MNKTYIVAHSRDRFVLETLRKVINHSNDATVVIIENTNLIINPDIQNGYSTPLIPSLTQQFMHLVKKEMIITHAPVFIAHEVSRLWTKYHVYHPLKQQYSNKYVTNFGYTQSEPFTLINENIVGTTFRPLDLSEISVDSVANHEHNSIIAKTKARLVREINKYDKNAIRVEIVKTNNKIHHIGYLKTVNSKIKRHMLDNNIDNIVVPMSIVHREQYNPSFTLHYAF